MKSLIATLWLCNEIIGQVPCWENFAEYRTNGLVDVTESRRQNRSGNNLSPRVRKKRGMGQKNDAFSWLMGWEYGDLFPFYRQRITVYWFQSPVDRWFPIPSILQPSHIHRWISVESRSAEVSIHPVIYSHRRDRPETWCSLFSNSSPADKWIILSTTRRYSLRI